MAHVNAQVRNLVATALEAIVELHQVSTTPGPTLLDGDLPVVVVQVNPDDVTVETKGKGEPALERRRLDLGVVLVADGKEEGLPDQMDALRALVEVAVAGALLGFAHHVSHTGGNLDVMSDEDGERWFAFLALAWDVEVWTHQGNPEVAI